jgi:predicted ATPase/DNA-binding SARP family transcriptional activator
MLVIRLLGQFSIQLDDRSIGLPSRPAQALFAYLVLNPGMPQRRERLAGLLWPDANDANARSNLRHVLWRIRKTLGEQTGQDYFPADDLTLSFNPDPGCWIDAGLVGGKSSPASPTLEEQVAAYQGELLPGFYDDWVTVERERLQAAFEGKIETLIDRLSIEKHWLDVIEWAEHWIKFGTAPEPAYRALMTAHARLSHKSKVKDAYQRCVEALQREFGVEPSEETQALYRRLLATRPLARPTAPEQAAAPRHNLPAQPTPLIGRETELAEIADRVVNDPACRLITLVGPGGIGKTRLALETGARALDFFADGVFFISLEAVTSPEALAPAILRVLSPAAHIQKDTDAQLIDHVRDKNLLLVLDNVEHLLEGAPRIGTLLATAPDIKIIVTSRERLHLPWEWLYEVQGLEYPQDGAESLERYSAVQLFLQMARRMRARFSLAEEQPHILRICQLVEGLPLGLELAAAWVRVMPCREIAQQIEHNLDLLSGQPAAELDRRHSIRAAFEYSWGLLAPEEQQVLMQLAAFSGGFRREAAARVAGAPLSFLFTLVDKSLLRVSATGRYDLHSLLRQYVSEKAVKSGQAAAQQIRLSHYYLDHARQHPRDYAALEEERINLMAGLEAAHRGGQAQLVLDYVAALSDMWAARGHWSDARKGYAWACDAARAHNDDRALTASLSQWGQACIEQGDYDEALAHITTSLDLADRSGETWRGAMARCYLARIAIERADMPQARQLLAESLSTFEQLQDAAGLAEVFYRQAWIDYYDDQYEEARQAAQQALQIEESLHNDHHCIRVLCLLADIVHYGWQDSNSAEQYCQRALELCTSLKAEADMVTVLAHLADIHRVQGKLDAARSEAEAGLSLAKSMGDRKAQAHFLFRLSRIDVARHTDDLALAEGEQSLQLCRLLGDQWGEIYVLDHLAQIRARLNQTLQAQAIWREALRLAEARQHPLAEVLRKRLAS